MSANVSSPVSRKFRVRSITHLRCPRCEEGKLFQGWFRMHKACEKCGLKFEREQGFYLGSIYFNYGAAALVSVTAYCLLTFVYGFSDEVVLWSCIGFTTLFPLWFFRYARSIFLAIDYYIHPEVVKVAEVKSAPLEKTVTAAVAVDVDELDLVQEAIALSLGKPIRQEFPLSQEELTSLGNDDASAGFVVTFVVTLAVLFGLTLGAIAVYADYAMTK